MPMSNYLKGKIGDLTLRATAYTAPATIYLALYTNAVLPDGTGTEVSGGSYARAVITFQAIDSEFCFKNNAVIFPAATASWGTIVWYGIKDASTSGNLLYYGPLLTPTAVGTNKIVSFSANKFKVPFL